MALSRDRLFAYLTEQLDVDARALADETPLFSSSLLDSFKMVDLILFIESEAGVTLGPLDVTLDNLDSISRILACARALAPSQV
jgi:acyl carrier protein